MTLVTKQELDEAIKLANQLLDLLEPFYWQDSAAFRATEEALDALEELYDLFPNGMDSNIQDAIRRAILAAQKQGEETA